MLGRRHFRIKTLQSLYAFFQGGEPRIEVAEKNLLHSIDKLYELYFTLISFTLEVIHFYGFRMEEARNKFYPTEEEKNPNQKLINNRVVRLLQENIPLGERLNRYKVSWTDEQEMVRKVWQRLKESSDLKDYLKSGKDSFDEDREFLSRLFRKFIARSPEIQFYCEERNLFWADDFDVAAVFVIKTIKLIPEDLSPGTRITSLFVTREEPDEETDQRFIRELFRKTILNSKSYEPLIEERTRNWELDRIALTDIILLKMALTELIHFPEIPVKVTMNEYIDISKQFSSQKSKHFINGILDKLVADLVEEKKIVKTGRGLIE